MPCHHLSTASTSNGKTKMKQPPRPFKEVGVGNFAVQSSSDRYIGGNGDSDIDLPSVASWRSNLVALSQKHNLYFTAFQDKIHITIPRDLRQRIPATPDLILDLPRSQEAFAVGGYLDEAFPHSVNHLKIGDLGDLEILLMGCDDGDIIAYYTHLLIAEINLSSITQSPIGKTKPFFHENVGKSAWGLAIHKKSRLLAASSNLREVTIFVLGYSQDSDRIPEIESIEGQILPEAEKEEFPLIERPNNYEGRSFPAIISHIEPELRYAHNYRIKIPVGQEGHNIPSIDFVSDDSGAAKLVIASDINGNLWFLNIWTNAKRREKRLHRTRREGDTMGWGVLSIPMNCFRVEPTLQEAIGTSDPSHTRQDSSTFHRSISLVECLDITGTILDVAESSMFHPRHKLGMMGPGSTIEDDNRDRPKLELVVVDDNKQLVARPFGWGSLNEGSIADIIRKDAKLQNTTKFREMVDKRNKERIGTYSSIDSENEESTTTDALPSKEEHGKYITPDSSAVFRAFNYDIQLLPPCPGSMFSTICRNVVRQNVAGLQNLVMMDRLCMLHLIPELSLLVVASQAGRAALITLTRMKHDFSIYGPIVMFRLDLILPLKIHEDKYRPNKSLLGVAIAPLQSSELGDEAEKKKCEGQRRWRLILHYYDHTILSYELFRDQMDELIVV